jgi:nucleotide sugar dehydrogenase
MGASLSLPSDVVCIVGCGYVGEHLIEVFATGYKVIGYDISQDRINHLRSKHSNSNLRFTTDPAELSGASVFCLSVPTLVKDGQVDASYVESACATVLKYARPGNVVVIESSVAVGMSRTLLLELHAKGVLCGFSPERVDPGRTVPTAAAIPKIVSGFDGVAVKRISELYARVFHTVVPVSSMETAEMCKLSENCFRMINICWINEVSDACVQQRIDPLEMINACATKPFGFMKFVPGLGVGGHCIPVNPYYLFRNNELPLLRQATTLMEQRPLQKARAIVQLYPSAQRILVAGIGFKTGQSVLSHSPGLTLARALRELAREVTLYDPLVTEVAGFRLLAPGDWNAESLDSNFDAIVMALPQTGVDLEVLRTLKTALPVYPEFVVTAK